MIKKSTLSPETLCFSILKFFNFDEKKFNASFENVSLIVKFFSIERPPPLLHPNTIHVYVSAYMPSNVGETGSTDVRVRRQPHKKKLSLSILHNYKLYGFVVDSV